MVGGGDFEAGIHNFTRFIEDWGTALAVTDPVNGGAQPRCSINGCLINLWFSERATSRHVDTGPDYYRPPARSYGWDVGFAGADYWPPYVPSIYTIEREVWQEN